MKPRSWIKAKATSALLSPRAAFRKAKSNPGGLDAPNLSLTTSLPTPIPLPMLTILTRVIQFLNKNHLQEEAMYSKPGLGLECEELLDSLRQLQLPDLSVYNPHSIANVVKKILGELYEPLISSGISQQLLEDVSTGVVGREAERYTAETFKQIRSTTREFLQVFLGHLNNIAANRLSRMSVTNLALHVGIALIRPTDDRTVLSSKIMMRRRKCVAEILIRQASSLPYDCTTELNIPAIPELVSTPVIDTSTSKSRVSVPRDQLHFVQVSWDPAESTLTTEQLEEIFGEFGEIENLGINDQGNRAIIAFVSAQSAEAAENATTPYLHVRRRKPRRTEKQRDFAQRPEPILLENNFKPPSDMKSRSENSDAVLYTEVKWCLQTEKSTDSSSFKIPASTSREGVSLQEESSMNSPSQELKINRLDDFIVVEDIENSHVNVEVTSSARPSGADEQFTAQATVKRINEDTVDARLPQDTNTPQTAIMVKENAFPLMEEETFTTQKASATKAEEKAEVTPPPMHVNTLKIEQREVIGDIGHSTSQSETIEAKTSQPPTSDSPSKIPVQDLSAPADDSDDVPLVSPTSYGPEPNDNGIEAEVVEPFFSPADEPRTGPFNRPTASTENIITYRDACIATNDSTEQILSMDGLQCKLLEMEKILGTSTSALSAANLPTEFERAVLQLHQQILSMVTESLVLSGARRGGAHGKMGTYTCANAEFLDFLEVQSKTQVKILEVEVRAGQELLRLHKSQHEKERLELEEEMTALHVGRSETDRICGELRADLRKCRRELACHVANAATIQREKSALEEKLEVCEEQLRHNEVAHVKLQKEYDEMYRVAAEAQMRVEKFKAGDSDDNKIPQDNQSSHALNNLSFPTSNVLKKGWSSAADLLQTTKFLSKHPSRTNVVVDTGSPANTILESAPNRVQSSNVATLEAVKQQMAREIQEQLATTRAALQEMEVCSASGKTLEEEEEELRQLQRQLATKSAEMDEAMRESRSKLKKLVEPTTALSPDLGDGSANLVSFEDIASNQEATIFDYTELVNELLARTERAPTSLSTQQNQLKKVAIDDFRLDSGMQSRLNSSNHAVREAQSVLYQKWTADRARKIAQLETYRDKQSVLQAQQSMQAFQKTLAEFRDQR